MHFLFSTLPHTSCFPGLGDLSLPCAEVSAPGQALPADPPPPAHPSTGQQKQAAEKVALSRKPGQSDSEQGLPTNPAGSFS